MTDRGRAVLRMVPVVEPDGVLGRTGRRRHGDRPRGRRHAAADPRLVTSRGSEVEVSRTLFRAGVDHERVPYDVGLADAAAEVGLPVLAPA